jgi:hypothetical protein
VQARRLRLGFEQLRLLLLEQKKTMLLVQAIPRQMARWTMMTMMMMLLSLQPRKQKQMHWPS